MSAFAFHRWYIIHRHWPLPCLKRKLSWPVSIPGMHMQCENSSGLLGFRARLPRSYNWRHPGFSPGWDRLRFPSPLWVDLKFCGFSKQVVCTSWPRHALPCILWNVRHIVFLAWKGIHIGRKCDDLFSGDFSFYQNPPHRWWPHGKGIPSPAVFAVQILRFQILL